MVAKQILDLDILVTLVCEEQEYIMTVVSMMRGVAELSNIDRAALWHQSCASEDEIIRVREESKTEISNMARKIVCFYSIPSGADLLGKKLSSDIYCNITTGSHSSKEELTVLAMVGERFGLQQFDSLPSGVSSPFRHALDKCRDSSPNNGLVAAYVLLGRQDLAMSTLTRK